MVTSGSVEWLILKGNVIISDQKQLSIIIPAYNYAHLLKRAAVSVLEQPGDYFEVIIVDDGSTDDTASVISELQQKYTAKLRDYWQLNNGVASARNLGIDKAKGLYLLFLDADDELVPAVLHNILISIKRFPKADLLIGGHVTVNEDGQCKEHSPGEVINDKKANFIAYFNKQLKMSHGAFVVKKAMFNAISYPETLKNSEDIPVFGQLLANSETAVIDEPLVKIYKHNDSLRNQIVLSNSVSMDVVEKLFNPAIIPSSLLKYKSNYTARRALSLSRVNYLAGGYSECRKWYVKALSYDAMVIFKLSYLRKYIKSFFKKGK